ncbi:glycoside hydrolase family 15 protein [Dictyobacter arantiisoli]|uniref:Glucoamylase n=1 Tax=Dictyobacter arantiisoli TaxID=2014874 RepID=A0A5A5TBS8_9CHLR|nr:glycoside hydrolase family 15 protein [Dictyobacter arantiisoli]GCF08685.1 glucoamylase [Dictyobacter arantiisoli]
MNTSPHKLTGYQPIEDYAVIGDMHTVALVGKNGSIDWYCLPHFDSPSIFGAILDAHNGGRFRIAPAESDSSSIRHDQLYVPETNILITRFITRDGVAEITDFMSIRHRTGNMHRSLLIRSVKVIRGSLTLELTCRPAFQYAREMPGVTITQEGALFQGNDLQLALTSSVPLLQDDDRNVSATFTLHAGHSARFFLEDVREGAVIPAHRLNELYYDHLQHTLNYWRNWLAQCCYQGRWREMVQRSALVLKLLTYAPTGAIVAAPTTSLPKIPGGTQNWDYRYTWLRDASYTIYTLLSLGFTQEAEAFMGWLDARCHEIGEHGALQPIYSIDGHHDLTEVTLDHLEGYRGSRPVRIGNAVAAHQQLDIYGELMDAIYLFNRYSLISYDLWQHVCQSLEWLRCHWQEPDAGIWEECELPRRFVHSRVMCWVAFDRALRMAHYRGLPAPIHEWESISAQIYEQVMDQGWNEQKRSFIQYYGSEDIDASALLFLFTKFTSPTDPCMQQTIDRIQKELTTDALVLRFSPRKRKNGQHDKEEDTFSACSFWLAESLARSGHCNDGRLMLEKMLTYSNHVGLYAEKIGLVGEALGNYPHAFTHLSLITACYHIDQALNREKSAIP